MRLVKITDNCGAEDPDEHQLGSTDKKILDIEKSFDLITKLLPTMQSVK